MRLRRAIAVVLALVLVLAVLFTGSGTLRSLAATTGLLLLLVFTVVNLSLLRIQWRPNGEGDGHDEPG